MKKIYTILMLCVLALTGFQAPAAQAQTIEIVNPPQSTILSATTNELYISNYIYIKNKTMFMKRVRIARKVIELSENHVSAFCWGGNCFLPEQDTSTIYEMKGGETTSEINAFNPKIENIYGNPGTSRIAYTIYDVDDPTDRVTIEFTYIVSLPTDVRPFDVAPVTVLSNSFPSPAYDNARIDYNIAQPYQSATLTVYNLIGNPVHTVRLDAPRGNVNIQTSSLPPGVYFYSIAADGKKLATRKLVVKH